MSLDAVFSPAGPVAGVIAEMGWVLTIGAAAVFALVMALLVWALLRQRAPASSADPLANARGTAGVATRWVVGGGFVFPVVVLSALLAYTAWRTAALTSPREADELVITVKARLWWWEVRYREPTRGIDLVLANQIHLPVGRMVTLGLVSDEVIHSLWVPALAGKVDMVPGRVHQLRLRADQPGTFRGQCAEFCGEQHARMALHVVAQTPDEFERWLQQQQRPAEPPRGAEAERGLQVFGQQRCGACHTVRGLGPESSLGPEPESSLGPELTHIGSRSHLGAGTLPMSRAALVEWVGHTQRAKPGARMPSYGELLDAASLQALAAFLEQLK